MNGCPFCQNQIEESAFLHSENFRVIYNIAPVLPGHSLLIPIHHHQSLLDLPPSHYQEMMALTVKTVKLLMQVFKADGFDLTIQDGTSAGQTVNHLHIHLIPRHSGDLKEPGDWYPKLMEQSPSYLDSKERKKLAAREINRIAEHLRTEAEKNFK